MADIRNDQYLHRPGAGRGAITPTDPLEARLYDGAGQPIAPATEGKQDSIIAALNTLATTLGTEATLGLLKAALDTISGKVATETTLGQAVQKLTDLLARLENALDVDVSDNAERELGKVTLTGHSVPDGQPIPAKLLGTRADTLARRFTGMYRIARVGQLAANTTETVADITDGASYDIEYIELATNNDSDIRFTIQGYQENGGLAGAMRPITATGSSEIGLSAANVRQHGSAQWELAVDDPQQNRYKLVCKRQVPVGRGFRVQVMNVNMTTPYNAGVIIQYNKTAS